MNDSDDDATPLQLAFQIVFAAQFLSQDRFAAALRAVYARLEPPRSPPPTEDVLEDMHDVLDAIGMSIVRVRNDFDQNRVYYLLTHAPLPAKLDRRLLSEAQAAQFKEILDIIFSDGRCEGISPHADLPRARFSAKDEIIAVLETHRWLERLPDARVTISTRCLYEMEPYLAERFGGRTLHRCLGCNEWFLAGHLCSNTTCPGRLHARCYSAYFQSRGEAPGVCPLCGSAIPA